MAKILTGQLQVTSLNLCLSKVSLNSTESLIKIKIKYVEFWRKPNLPNVYLIFEISVAENVCEEVADNPEDDVDNIRVLTDIESQHEEDSLSTIRHKKTHEETKEVTLFPFFRKLVQNEHVFQFKI